MTDMIERVALSVANAKRAKHDIPPCRWEHLTDDGQVEYLLYARAAIEAMREPSDRVAEVMNAHAANSCVDWRDFHDFMIDEALK